MSYDVRANRAEITRLTKAIAAEEQNINLAFQRIGQTYFAAHRGDPEDSQKADIQAVLDAMQRANSCKEQINVLRGIAICPGCKAEVDASSAFCSRCGTRMPVQTPPAAPDAPVCPNCGKPCAAGTRFCSLCGARLPAVAPAAPAAPYAAAAQQSYTSEQGATSAPSCVPAPNPTPAPSCAVAEETVSAPSVAPPVEAQTAEQHASAIPEPVFHAPQNSNRTPVFNSVFDIEPAFPVPEEEPAQASAPSCDPIPEPEPVTGPIPEPAPEPPAAPRQKFCPNCGTPLDPDYRFCLECGTPVQ